MLLLEQDARRVERERAASYYSPDTKIERSCVGLPDFVATAECLIEKSTATHEKKHVEADLEAQQSVASSTYALFWLGLVGFIASAIGLALLYENLRVLQTQIEGEKADAIERSAQFNRQIEKMEEANSGARVSAERQLRAYVSYDSMKMLELKTHSKHFQIQWKNTGQTPTKRLRTKWGWWCGPDLPPEDDFDFPDQYPHESAAAGGVGNAGAGGLLLSNGPILTSEQFNAVLRGELKVLYWAWVDYNDVFPDTPRRRSEACYKLVAVPADGQIQVGWIGWGRFNGTDEECLKAPEEK